MHANVLTSSDVVKGESSSVVAAELRQLLQRSGMTKQQVAIEVGVTRNTVRTTLKTGRGHNIARIREVLERHVPTGVVGPTSLSPRTVNADIPTAADLAALPFPERITALLTQPGLWADIPLLDAERKLLEVVQRENLSSEGRFKLLAVILEMLAARHDDL